MYLVSSRKGVLVGSRKMVLAISRVPRDSMLRIWELVLVVISLRLVLSHFLISSFWVYFRIMVCSIRGMFFFLVLKKKSNFPNFFNKAAS